MAASTPPQNLVCLVSFFFIALLCNAPVFSSQPPIPAAANSQKHQAEKLIREQNLFPKHGINMGRRERDESLAEKKVKPNFARNLHPFVQDLGQHAGYINLPDPDGGRMFYFHFESQNSIKDPLILWLTGGPGCGGELALFFENGPYHLASNLSLEVNKYGWNKVSNIIFVDQPIGTGFSCKKNASNFRHDEVGVSNDLNHFLQAFLQKHPEMVANDFYIIGESYAGHYIPHLASRVLKGNMNNEGIHINLKGFAIGNGLTNSKIQYQSYTNYASMMKLIDQSTYDNISKMIPPCNNAATSCDSGGEKECLYAFKTCNRIYDAIKKAANGTNPFDIRKKCHGKKCYDFSRLEKFLNDQTVRNVLGVGKMKYVMCNYQVYQAMLGDWMRNLAVGIPDLLKKGLNFLNYVGEYDLICNSLGNLKWTEAMEWSGKKEFEKAPTVPLVVDGVESGKMKAYGPLTFIKVFNAGHMVPMDQPKVMLHILKTWIKGNITA